MTDALTPVLRALDARRAPLTMFLRDDDAGWETPRLMALIDVTQAAGAAIDLAVIPQATGEALAETLCARIDAAPGSIGVHQHGFAHLNHETLGRRCEFGSARSVSMQRHDLRQGRTRLRTLFGHRLDDFFTPPWNRCSAATPAVLAELGFKVLSRDRTALPQGLLPELNVTLDWCKHSRDDGRDLGPVWRTLADAVQLHADVDAPLGLMLHHGPMTAADLDGLRGFLLALQDHGGVRWQAMRDLVPQRSLAGAH